MKTLLKIIGFGLEDLREKFKKEIKVLITDEEYDNHDDVIHEAPRVFEVSKHGYHIEYVVMSVYDGKVKVGGIGEDHGEVKRVEMGYLSDYEVYEILKYIYSE